MRKELGHEINKYMEVFKYNYLVLWMKARIDEIQITNDFVIQL